MVERTEKLLSLSSWVVCIGAVTLLVGLAWDAALHRLDPGLAAREGIFTLSNPGHVLFGGGIALIVVGVLMFFAGKARAASQPLLFTLPGGAMTLLATASFALAASTGTLGGPGHDHDDSTVHTHDSQLDPGGSQVATTDPSTLPAELEGDGHVHGEPQASEDQPVDGKPASTPQGLLHEHGEGVAVTAAELEAAAQLVADTRAAAVRFESLRVALNEGYYQVAPPRNGLAHYMNPGYNRDGRILDPERPESLIYLRINDQDWKLVGVMYRMPSPDEPGPRIGGALTAWHAHDNLCVENGRVVGTTNNGPCPRGVASKTPEMLHVWLVENPDGVFSDDMEPSALTELVKSPANP